jgi:general secretion pathway protein C
MLTRPLHPGHLLLLALFLACGVLGWRAVSVARQPLATPPPFSAPPMADRALLSRFDPFFPARAGGGESLPVTALPFSLHGVRADSATGRGSAIIASGDGQQMVYAVGDSVGDGVTLVAIAADHVVLERGGTREALWLDSAGGDAVQRYDPTATEPMPPPPPDPDAIADTDVPAPVARPAAPPSPTADTAESPVEGE